MFMLMKFLHFLGLVLGAGAGLGSMVVARQIRQSPGAPVPQLMALRPVFARVSLAGVLLLWVTGLWLYLAVYRGTPLGGGFHAKLAFATLLLAAGITINVVISRARAAGAPPPAWLPKLGMAMPVLALGAVAFAVYVFN